MENSNIKKKRPSNSLWGGLIITIVGLVFLLRNLNIYVPHWVFSWHTILLVVGLAIGFKRDFRGGGWLIMVLVGGLFTLEDIANFDFNFSKLTWPIILIALGLFLILRPKKPFRRKSNPEYLSGNEDFIVPEKEKAAVSGDIIDSVNVFGGSHQKVFSKNFRGGDILAVFGGCDLDLTQADFNDVIIIEVTAIFGGCKIILPPTWEVKSEVVAIFGGVDDKRNLMPSIEGGTKRVIIKGLALFGGVDIRNY